MDRIEKLRTKVAVLISVPREVRTQIRKAVCADDKNPTAFEKFLIVALEEQLVTSDSARRLTPQLLDAILKNSKKLAACKAHIRRRFNVISKKIQRDFFLPFLRKRQERLARLYIDRPIEHPNPLPVGEGIKGNGLI
jgi:hypothetical protein